MLKIKRKAQKVSLRNLPSKRSINLATVGEKPIKPSQAIPGIIIIIVIAGLISKFAVYDRLAKVMHAQAEVSSLQQQIDEGYKMIEEFGDLADEYAHYTYSGMTADELNRADRIAVIDMIKNDVMPTLDVTSWTIKDNQLDMTVSGETLQRINEVAANLQNNEDIVDYTTVMTASTANSRASSRYGVTARIVVFLNGTEKEAVK